MSILPLLLWLFTTLSLAQARFEPYEVLGVHRRANNQDIKKAYKAKIRQWHPDLNLDPESQAKFIELNTAYELLSDPDRRRSYDNHGITEDSPNFRKVRILSLLVYFGQGRLDLDCPQKQRQKKSRKPSQKNIVDTRY